MEKSAEILNEIRIRNNIFLTDRRNGFENWRIVTQTFFTEIKYVKSLLIHLKTLIMLMKSKRIYVWFTFAGGRWSYICCLADTGMNIDKSGTNGHSHNYVYFYLTYLFSSQLLGWLKKSFLIIYHVQGLMKTSRCSLHHTIYTHPCIKFKCFSTFLVLVKVVWDAVSENVLFLTNKTLCESVI